MTIAPDKIKEIINNNYDISKITESQIKDLSSILDISIEDVTEYVNQIKDARELAYEIEERFCSQLTETIQEIDLLRERIQNLRSDLAKGLKPGEKPISPVVNKVIGLRTVSRSEASQYQYVKDAKDI